MTSVLLIIHIILAIVIIGLVLLQRSSGGGLGVGETGGAGGFATPRSAANILTKATTWCAIAFFGTSLGLAMLAGQHSNSAVLKELQETTTPAVSETAPAANADETPAASTTPADNAAPEVPTDDAAPVDAPAAETKAPEAPTAP